MNIYGLLGRLDRIEALIPADLSKVKYGVIFWDEKVKDFVVPKKIRTKAMKKAGPGSYRILIEKPKPMSWYEKKYGFSVDGKAEETPEKKKNREIVEERIEKELPFKQLK